VCFNVLDRAFTAVGDHPNAIYGHT
jgi:hypothetical protein